MLFFLFLFKDSQKYLIFRVKEIKKTKSMKKIEFVSSIAKSLFGETAEVYSNLDPCYCISLLEGQVKLLIYVDKLKTGKISIKLKGLNLEEAEYYSKVLLKVLNAFDNTAKADVYTVQGAGGVKFLKDLGFEKATDFVARVRMNKVWE